MKFLNSMVLAVAMLFVLISPAMALDFSLGPHWDGVKDSTSYLNGFHGDSVPQIATGLCSGVLIKLKNEDKTVANILSPCVIGGTTFEAGEENTADLFAGFKVIEVMGVNGGIYFTPTRSEPVDKWYDRFVYGFGATLVGLGEKILK